MTNAFPSAHVVLFRNANNFIVIINEYNIVDMSMPVTAIILLPYYYAFCS